MLTGKYKSLEFIIEKVFRDTGIVEEVDIYDVVEWAGECLELIGVPASYINKVIEIDIKEGRGILPCNIIYIRQVRYCNGSNNYPMRYDSSNFHRYAENVNDDYRNNCDLTYQLNDDCVFTSFEEGKVQMACDVFAIDDKGFPLIPDNIKFVKAVEFYIREKIDYKLWRAGKLQRDVYEKTVQEQLWYLGAAQTAGVMPNADQMESIKNNWIRLIPNINQHSDYFKSFGQQEQRINHSSGRNRISSYPEVDRDNLFKNI
jgi:hypothetical protein